MEKINQAEDRSEIIASASEIVKTADQKSAEVIQKNLAELEARLQSKIEQEKEQSKLDALRERVALVQEFGDKIKSDESEEKEQETKPAQPVEKQQNSVAGVPIEPTNSPQIKENFRQRVSRNAKETWKDFSEGSNWKKAGYVAGGVVGFLAARWLYRKISSSFTN